MFAKFFIKHFNARIISAECVYFSRPLNLVKAYHIEICSLMRSLLTRISYKNLVILNKEHRKRVTFIKTGHSVVIPRMRLAFRKDSISKNERFLHSLDSEFRVDSKNRYMCYSIIFCSEHFSFYIFA